MNKPLKDGTTVPIAEDCPGSGRGRTRKDPLIEVWESEVLPMLEEFPDIRPATIFRELMRSHPELDEGIRRTLERRIRSWRLEYGPECEVVFRQVHEPGVLGLSDFTDTGYLGVTVSGVALPHILYHFRLAYSGFEYAHVVLGRESFTALSEGLQDALWQLGGVPRQHRTDSLSAAFRNLGAADVEDLTSRYRQLCGDLGMEPSRNNRGKAHENGAIEGPHGHLKRALEDALMLRGTRDFSSIVAYRVFVADLVSRRNAGRARRIGTEQAALGPLPSRRSVDYEDAMVRVTSSGGFTLRKVFYTVPSRLIGQLLGVRLYDDRLEVFAGGRALMTLPRGRCGKGGRRGWVVNYRHVIHSLRRKPMALQNLVYRDQLFPREVYRRTYELAQSRLTERQACRLAVGLLGLAHDHCCEVELAGILERCVEEGRLPDLAELESRLGSNAGELPRVDVKLPPLSNYDSLIGDPERDPEDGGADG